MGIMGGYDNVGYRVLRNGRIIITRNLCRSSRNKNSRKTLSYNTSKIN